MKCRERAGMQEPPTTLEHEDVFEEQQSDRTLWGCLRASLWRPGALLVLILALLLYGTTYLMGTFGRPIRADGVGYSIYLPSWVIFHTWTVDEAAESWYADGIPSWTGCKMAESGHYVDKYGMGCALMALPFFLVAHFLTWFMAVPGAWDWWAFQFSPDGCSAFYQHAVGLAGLLFMWAGLVISHFHLRWYFGRKVSLCSLALLLLGSNLLHYMTAESVLSHGYAFFLFSLLLLHLDLVQRRGKMGWKDAVVTGCIVGVIGMVRVPNLLFALCIPLWGCESWRAFVAKCRGQFGMWLLGGFVAVAVFSPQLLTWRATAGSWALNAYGSQGEGFDWLHPKVWNVLFSLRGGIFFWAPALLTGLAGLALSRWRKPVPWLWCIIVYLPLQLWIVSSWHDWAYGGGFGHRGFIESYSLWLFPMAAWMSFCEGKTWWVRWGNRLACLVFVLWNLFMMKLYFARELSYFGLDAQALFDIFYGRFQLLRAWFG